MYQSEINQEIQQNTVQDRAENTTEPVSNSQVQENKLHVEQQTKKKGNKAIKIVLIIIGWIVLLCAGAGIALYTKPEPEIIHEDPTIESYKRPEPKKEIIDTVDDLDYYGTYTPNPIKFNELVGEEYETYYKEVRTNTKGYTISGLKNKEVEEKINNRIIEEIQNTDITYEYINANYFNLLSIEIYQHTGDKYIHKYITFDLNTGNELTFDDLFSPNVNLTSLLFKSFYDKFSIDLQSTKNSYERYLSFEKEYPNPADCFGAMYCPTESYDAIREKIAKINEQLANLEETVLKKIQEYLSGDKIFYLNPYGPAFVLSDGEIIEMELKDNIRYAVYLKNYRSSSSIYEDDTLVNSNPFFTENKGIFSHSHKIETDDYLFDYNEDLFVDIDHKYYDILKEHILNKGLSIKGDQQKFRHIFANSYIDIEEKNNIRYSYTHICLRETDKAYYKSTYKYAIIDGRTQQSPGGIGIPIAREGHYDTEKVTPIPLEENGNNCSEIHTIITDSGEILESLDDILINPSNTEIGWKEYLDNQSYIYSCYRAFTKKCYTEEEKKTNNFIYSLGPASIYVSIKDDSEEQRRHLTTISLSDIPSQYINQSIYIKKQ